MTTIAIRVYSDKVIVASDTFMGGDYPGHYTKHTIIKNKIVGTAGESPWWERFEDWVARGMPKDSLPKIDDKAQFDAFIWDEKNGIRAYYTADASFKINSIFHAVGTGAPYALGAMEMGATPEDAVKIACRYDRWSKSPVRTSTLMRKLKK